MKKTYHRHQLLPLNNGGESDDAASTAADVCPPAGITDTEWTAAKTYAVTAAEPASFQKVTNKSNSCNNETKMIVGTANPQSTCPFEGVVKKVVLSVCRLRPDTTASAVWEYLNKSGINVISCYDLKGSEKYNSVRLCVGQCHLRQVMNAEVWPQGAVVRPWVFKPRTNQNTDVKDDKVVGDRIV